MTTRTAARIAAGLLGLVMAFQIAVALGAPWGAFTQGGGSPGVLPSSGRIFAVASFFIVGVMALAILARAGEGPLASAPRRLVTVLAWFTLAYMCLAVVVNVITPSANERLVWAPLSLAILFFASIVMARTARRGSAA
jgi:hypothetical protein